MNVRMKCGSCGETFSTNVPLCPECQARELAGAPGGAVGWVVYHMVPVPDVGPFFSAAERDLWYRDMHRTHPHLVRQRVDAIQEVIPEAVLRRLDG